MSVVRRRESILALVSSRRLATQDDLVAALRDVGIEASQASVSRDIAALGLIKVGGRWAPPSAMVFPATRSNNASRSTRCRSHLPATTWWWCALRRARLRGWLWPSTVSSLAASWARWPATTPSSWRHRMQRRHAGFASGSRPSCRCDRGEICYPRGDGSNHDSRGPEGGR